LVLTDSYIPVAILVIIGIAFPFMIMGVGSLLRPKKAEKDKYVSYECGIVPTGEGQYQHNVQFYMIAILFAVFDVEIVFMFPWAVVFQELGMFAFVEMFIFIVILCMGLGYAWKEGALEWT